MEVKSGLRKTMLRVSLIPLVLFGVIITICCSLQLMSSIHQEVESGLKSVAQSAIYIYEKEFPGSYWIDPSGSTVYKGDKEVVEAREILEEYKKISGADITIFYNNQRVVTTICNAEGKPIIGTLAGEEVTRDVLKGKDEKFYAQTTINDEGYFSYYCPLYDSDKNCVGMVFAGKASHYVRGIVLKGVIPVVVIILLCIGFMVFIICSYADRLTVAIQMLQEFLMKIEGGNLKTELGAALIRRKDEIGRIGKSAVQMQDTLRDLVERDSLTGLYNRHYGETWLREVQKKSRESGEPFYVVIGDIDFFKKFNDNYGHDCGDMVLRGISRILESHVEAVGYVARWGGEEFLLVLSHRQIEDVVSFVQQIADDVRQTQMVYGEECLGVRMTFGIADGDCDRHIDELIKKADQALYEGKEGGRDRVVYNH